MSDVMMGVLPAVCLATCLLLTHVALTLAQYTSPDEDNFYRVSDQRFRTASREQLLTIWHTECHRRCQWVLHRHVAMACLYDPYKVLPETISRRSVTSLQEAKVSRKRNIPSYAKRTNRTIPLVKSETPDDPETEPFMRREDALQFLKGGRRRTKKSARRGITEECCFEKVCSWEEYGEYCHDYVRSHYARPSTCAN